MSKIQSKGPFWYNDETGEILSFPYDPDQLESAKSKNGLTYTHKKLWKEIAGQYSKYPYNYFPRGRVEIDNKGRSIIYMNPNVPDSVVSEIRSQFGIPSGDVRIIYDNSSHYKCHLDDGYIPDR